MGHLRTMDDIPLDGKRVYMRVDFNVSVHGDGSIGADEDYRIETALETLQELRRRRCRVIILPRRGRPEENPEEADIKPVWRHLQRLVQDDIRLLNQLYGPSVEAVAQSMAPGDIIMLPNVRSDLRELHDNEKFAQQLAKVADAYVSESFGEAHRARSSLSTLPTLMPSCAGRRTQLEVEMLTKLRNHPERPYVAIASGSKVTTKVDMLLQLLREVDTLCLGGQIANVFLAAKGLWYDGQDKAEVKAAELIIQEAGPKLLLPVDVVTGTEDGSSMQEVMVDEIPAGTTSLWDIGPKSTRAIIDVCQTAQTVMWNGPVGRFEVDAYALSTRTLADALAQMSAYRVVGGGDTVNAIEKYKLTSQFDHVSVGGGAMVAFLEGKTLPGLEPLFTK